MSTRILTSVLNALRDNWSPRQGRGHFHPGAVGRTYLCTDPGCTRTTPE